ncbi:site-specific integrase [Pectobacterium carotovorum subsp. carotovorum]|nr:site-specific integrase [Pectobacterium carotovorum]MCL6397203.1 site-specific integrase [Pectobacterium carotovorum subsp. carotovorum]
MAFFTIEKRLRSDGTSRYRCTVGVKKNGVYEHRESRTFTKQTIAKSWGTKRVAHIEEFGVPQKVSSAINLAKLISDYINHKDVKLGKTKRESLTRIMKSDLAEAQLHTITSKDYIEFCQMRKAQGCAPSTISNDIAFISTVLQSAKPLFGVNPNIEQFNEAKQWLKQMKMVGSSNKRTRRPTADEFDLILNGLHEKSKTAYSGAPFGEMFLLSALTCTRIGELCRILWDDIDDEQKAVLVRDRKDPKKKIGNHMYVPLLGEAWDIVQRQPRKDARIFPYRSRSITQTYRQVRDDLGIEDLRYHDLRREGASRLFEAGFSIEDVAQVTGHRSLNLLWQVYTSLFPKSLHEKFEKLKSINSKE